MTLVMIGRDVRILYDILNNPNWYSYSLNGIIKKLNNCSKEYVLNLIQLLAEKFNDYDPINIFEYNNITYVGFESRRIDYERDKINGVNKIEKLIEKGFYGKHK